MPFVLQAAGRIAAGLTGSCHWFTERAKDTGLDFVHFNGMSGGSSPTKSYRGVALFDYDNDGDLDVFVNKPLSAARPRPEGPYQPTVSQRSEERNAPFHGRHRGSSIVTPGYAAWRQGTSATTVVSISLA